MKTAVVLFTRDLRVHDNPVLHAACAAAERVVPLFVLDPTLRVPANRARFLAESLADLRASLRALGGDLVIHRGDPVTEAVRLARAVGAFGIAMAADASAYATSREERLAHACERERLALKLIDSHTVVPPGAVRPSSGGDHYKVFTPYWRVWQAYGRRAELAVPDRVVLPDGVEPGDLPEIASGGSPVVVGGGETAGRARLDEWAPRAGEYADGRDDLAGDRTSRLSPYLRFGCLSPVTVAAGTSRAATAGTSRAVTAAGTPQGGTAEAFVRQLCWRDFYQQILAGFPDLGVKAYRAGAVEEWGGDPVALEAWREGQTGVPVVDAGMRQLAAEGWMHNRARMITASYLVKELRLDWREGVRRYAELLLDADVGNNCGNWQWTAGTGTDTKPYRRFNPLRQARRFDPEGEYVRRWVPELADIPGGDVHIPWESPARPRGGLSYPRPPGTLL